MRTTDGPTCAPPVARVARHLGAGVLFVEDILTSELRGPDPAAARHGVQKGEQLPHGGHDGNLLGLAVFDEPVVKGLQGRVGVATLTARTGARPPQVLRFPS